MTEKDFIQKCGFVEVNFQGFEESSINESVYPKEFHRISVNCSYSGNQIFLRFLSHEWNSNTESFFQEVQRRYQYIAKQNNLTEEVRVLISLTSGREKATYQFSV